MTAETTKGRLGPRGLRITRVAAVVLAILAGPAAYDYARSEFFDPNTLYNVCGLLGCIVILIGVWLHRPARPWAWFLIAAGNLTFIVGDLVYIAQDANGAVPYPGLADVFYLAGYPLIAAGLVLFRDRERGDRGSMIDATVHATSAGLMAWVFLIEPYAADASLTLGAKLVSIAYPMGDIVLLAAVAWIFLSSKNRTASVTWLLLSTSALLASDIVYGLQSLAGTYAGGWTDAGYILSYLTFGSAAIDPSMRWQVTDRSDAAHTESRWRLVLLFAAALLGPGLMGLMNFQGRPVDLRVMTVGTMTLFALVLARMSDLLKTVQRNARLLALREAELSETVDLLRTAEEARTRLLDSVMTAAERERTSIAGDLHDGPVQHLTTLSLEADIAAMEVAAGDLESAGEAIVAVQKGLSHEIEALRSMMANLRPPVLDERGLVQALQDTVATFRQQTDIDVVLDAQIDERPDRVIETIVYRVAQEALTNVRKHSQASQVAIRCKRHGSRMIFELRDNGVGFDSSAVEASGRKGHLGLSLMQERVELAGGEWTLVSTPGSGTVLTATFELETNVGEEAARTTG